MIYALLLGVCSAGGAVGTYFLGRACKEKQIKIFKRQIRLVDFIKQVLALLLFVVYIPHLFGKEIISEQVGLSGGTLFSPFGYVGMCLLDWLTTILTVFAIISPFFPKQEAKDFRSFLSLPILLANIILIKPVAVSIHGVADMTHWRTIVFAINVVLMSMICGASFIEAIVAKDFENIGKRLGKSALSILLYAMAFMPIYFPQLILGEIGGDAEGFSVTHRLMIYAACIIPVGIYISQRKKSMEDRHFLLITLSFAGVVQYFAWQLFRTRAQILPLHLCNTAIILMFFAYIFKLKSLYYFTYFINVLGALCAIILPEVSGELSLMQNMVYWYDHLYAFFLPLLGVATGVFERPKLKAMSKSLIVFTLYILGAAVLNTYLNGSKFGGFDGKYGANYFFLYDDFFIDKFSFAYPLKYNFIVRFTLFGSEMECYPLYTAVIYLVFIVLIFVMWGAYMMLFSVSDSHRELAYRKKLQKVDRLNLLKELDGRPQGSPLNPEGVNMVKIKNFSKTYAGSTKKSVDDLSLEIHDGEVFGFIGHNGAGKSTTIKSLVGIQSITEGSIEIEGYDIARQPLEAKLRLGYVSDNHALYEKLTGREYINYVADLYMVSKEDKEARINKFVKMFQLEHAIDNEIKSYSHGMKQKTMVIAALIHNPKVWVLDEPLTGLDPTSAWQIKECMREHANAGNIVFFSSHVIEVVEKICDKIAIISGGKLRRVNTIEEIKAEGLSLEQLYLQYAQKKEEPVEEAQASEEAV